MKKYLILLGLLVSSKSFAVTGTCSVTTPPTSVTNPVQVKWCNPTENEPDINGVITAFDPTTELEMIKIYCGPASGAYDRQTPIVGSKFPPTVESITDWAPLETALVLTEGSWYCALTAVNLNGGESKFSNEVIIILNPTIVQPVPPVLSFN